MATPYDRTTHEVRQGDARDLSDIEDESVHLVVTSPPYWTLKEYPLARGNSAQSRTMRRFSTSWTRHGAKVAG